MVLFQYPFLKACHSIILLILLRIRKSQFLVWGIDQPLVGEWNVSSLCANGVTEPNRSHCCITDCSRSEWRLTVNFPLRIRKSQREKGAWRKKGFFLSAELSARSTAEGRETERERTLHYPSLVNRPVKIRHSLRRHFPSLHLTHQAGVLIQRLSCPTETVFYHQE